MALFLIVDDEDPIRKLLRQFVEKEGHEVLEARNVEEAWEQLDSEPDALLLDVDLPGQTGLDLLFELRKQERFRELPVIFVTAHPARTTPFLNSRKGPLAVLPKPFHRADLIAALRKIPGDTVVDVQEA